MSSQIEMVDHDDDIEQHHERTNLVDNMKVVAKKPSFRKMCCKGIVLSVACLLFLLMMVQLWTDYGSYIETNTFPPKIKSISTHCKNSTRQQDAYLPLVCDYDNDTLVCQMEKPAKVFIQVCPHSDIQWSEASVSLTPYEHKETVACMDLIVWSI